MQAKVQELIIDFDEGDFDAILKSLEKEIPKILLDDNVKNFLDIRRGLTRLRMARDPASADKKLEEFYNSSEVALNVLENFRSN